MLDPRYKMMPFLQRTATPAGTNQRQRASLTPVSSVTSTEAKSVLLEQINAIGLGNNDSDNSGVVTASQSQSSLTESAGTSGIVQQQQHTETGKKSIFSRFNQQLSVEDQDHTEDVRYLSTPTCPNVMSAAYWLNAQESFPTLAKLARRYLSIPASSACVERLFSVCGAIIRARRARLGAKTVEALLFHMERNK